MMTGRVASLVLPLLMYAVSVGAQSGNGKEPDYGYQECPCTGTLGSHATINVPAGLMFIDAPNTRKFLEGLEAAGMAMDNTSLAALGPKMVALSGEKTAGAHPYLVDPEHTRQARAILGPGKLLAPEQGVAFGATMDEARKAAIQGVSFYKTLPNYRNNWLRLGYTDAEIDADADRFIDGIVACGEVATMAARVRDHWQAGADHVCVQIISAEGENDFATLTERFRKIAQALS